MRRVREVIGDESEKAEVQWLRTPFITSITSITFITTE
jgi:hypothetical protein